MRLRTALLLVLIPGLALAAPTREIDDLVVPQLEVKTPAPPLELPAVPSFDLPAQEPGFVSPKYLRVGGKDLLDKEVQVKGYVIWVYDCIEANLKPKQTRAQLQKLIDADPTICERPKLYLGDARDTPVERGLWIVDVPRPPNKLEKQRLSKEDLATWPAVPKLAVGDYVVITGDFKVESPHMERNSDGLVVFKAVAPAKPSTVAATAQPTAVPAAAPAAPAAQKPARKATPIRDIVDPKLRSNSLVQMNAANKAAGQRQWTEAVEYDKRALAFWPGNHAAWYGLGLASSAQGDWKTALDALDHAVKLRPDVAMYQMWAGIAAYEAERQAARVDQAAKRNVKPEDISPDMSAVANDRARSYLDAAVAIEPALWRAHYYLGKLAREHALARPAAEEFTKAVQADRSQQAPYIALGELYRKWDYTDEAIKVATLGTQQLPADATASDVYYVLAMAYDDKQDFARAVEQYSRALELKLDNAKALFQRGQCYVKLKKRKEAKADLEAFLAGASAPSLEFLRQQAQKMLHDLGAKR